MSYKNRNDPRLKLSRDKWYRKNKKRQIKQQSIRRKFLIAFLIRYKRLLKCSDCKMSFKDRPEYCDFHHIKPNTKRNMQLMTRYSLKSLKNEIRKCIPLCANCHRTRHKQA